MTKKNMDVYDTVEEVAFSMNNTPLSESGVTPHYAFFGWETRGALDFALNDDLIFPNHMVTYSEKLHDENDLRLRLIKTIKDGYAGKRNESYNARISELPVLKEGDLVLLTTDSHPLSSKTNKKLQVRRLGPYRVLKIDGQQAVLSDLDGNVVRDLVSLRRLSLIPGYIENFPADVVHTITECNETEPIMLEETGKTRYHDGSHQCLVRLKGSRKSTMWIPEEYFQDRCV